MNPDLSMQPASHNTSEDMMPEFQRLPKLTGLYIRNLAANLIGNFTIGLLNFLTPLAFLRDWISFISGGGWVVIPFFIASACIIVTVLQASIQRPISRYLAHLQRHQPIGDALRLNARRRLLNLPILLGMTNLSLWLLLDLLFSPLMYVLLGMTLTGLCYNFFRVLMVGLIASFISFFLIDDFVREKLVPIFFPHGRLTATPGTVRISILRRIRVLFGIGTNAPMVLLCVTIAFAVWDLDNAMVTTEQFRRGMIEFSLTVFIIFITMSLSLNLLVGKSILAPIDDMLAAARRIRAGRFHPKVNVRSNDELGEMGDGMNAMTDGLVERDRLRRGLYLAKEIQQALLPQNCPSIAGLDIAARCLFCDETGGDYFDFIAHGDRQLDIVVGDVSGHGISAAILMASVRAFLRQRAYPAVSLSEILSDVNRQFAADVKDSGSFMTLFYLRLDLQNRCLRWVRAGHEPAALYDPASDRFDKIYGKGVALGIAEQGRFEENRIPGLTTGQIIVLATDGAWEARNRKGDMFGREFLYEIIRRNPQASAEAILANYFHSLEKFQQNAVREDDITMVVIKVGDLDSACGP